MQVAEQAWQLVRQTSAGFWRDNVLQLSASLAFYTVFSLGPMLLVALFVAGLFWPPQALERHLFGEIQGLIGASSAAQIRAILQQAALGSSPLQSAPGVALLLFAATSALTDLQDALNTIWQLRVRPGAGWRMLVRARLLALALVFGLGGLLLASAVLAALVDGGLDRVQTQCPRAAAPLAHAADLILSWGLTASFFAVLYRVLPAALLRWRDVAAGAALAAALFLLGRYGIGYYLRTTDLGHAYGGAGALAVLLVWVYYSSLVLYAGAEFGKCYTLHCGGRIRAGRYALAVQIVPVATTHAPGHGN
ncbi:YihY/virulence factor BrkB family protein [Hymenobacter sp. BT175]|uniref:YihY/virulence factor BrkB family protein n=1 Tax=Hymenobacter translucens TaxID=2886507 RepID=UPI001D0DDA58|nr:YihY/virulence factor BrkB family protein [Hymenobacter translucens]MCC2545543.1 YihY/virulence factor BrkB family protein [Hymenobacter translucens]